MRKKGENEMQFIALFFHEMEEEIRFIFGCFDSIWEAVVRVVMSQRAHNLLNCVNVKAPTQRIFMIVVKINDLCYCVQFPCFWFYSIVEQS